MAKDVIIRGVTYSDTPFVQIPLADETGDAYFYDTSDATISSGGQSLSGVTSYGSDGTKYTGSIVTKTSTDLSASGDTVTAPAGYYASAASKAVASGSATTPATSITANPSISVNSTTGLITASVSASQSVTPSVSAGYISSGTAGTVSVSGSNTSQLTTKAAATITPGTSNQTIASGQFLVGDQTVLGDNNLRPANIVYGVTIFNTTGTAQIPVVYQDPDTHGLSIS